MVKTRHQHRLARSPEWYDATPASPAVKKTKHVKKKPIFSAWNSILPYLSSNNSLEIWTVQTTLTWGKHEKNVIRSCIVTKPHAIFPKIMIGKRGNGMDFMAFKCPIADIQKRDILHKESIVYSNSKSSNHNLLYQWNHKLQRVSYQGKNIEYTAGSDHTPLFKKEKEDNELIRDEAGSWHDKNVDEDTDESTEENTEEETKEDFLFINNDDDPIDTVSNHSDYEEDLNNYKDSEEDHITDTDSEDDINSDTFVNDEEDHITDIDDENEEYF